MLSVGMIFVKGNIPAAELLGRMLNPVKRRCKSVHELAAPGWSMRTPGDLGCTEPAKGIAVLASMAMKGTLFASHKIQSCRFCDFEVLHLSRQTETFSAHGPM
jgi:hypothetical protein